MRSLSPQNRQIMKEKVDGQRFHNVKTWQDMLGKQRPSYMQKVLSPIMKKEKLQSLARSVNDTSTLYSKAIDDSARMPMDTLGSVVNSVNFISKQLRSDLKICDQSVDDPLLQYREIMASCTKPQINRLAAHSDSEDEALEREDNVDSLADKGVKVNEDGHRSYMKRLEGQKLLILPKEQVESVPGAYDGDTCHFELFDRPVRDRQTQKQKIKRAEARRF